MDVKEQDIAVIGGGAAGMMAAAEAAKAHPTHQVVLLERNEKLGKKLYITGKGRCNLTNDSDLDGLVANTVHNGRFLYSAFSAFGSRELMDYMEGLGLPLAVERGGRVFPASGKASDVTRAFQRELARLSVDVVLLSRVKEIVADDGAVAAVSTEDGHEYRCRSAILATGGLSYPSTGSTGDGYRMAQALGHTIVPPRPALIPIELAEPWTELQGLSLKNVRLSAYQNGKKAYSEIGEMLFTHFGMSGPLVLTASSLLDGGRLDAASLSLDMKPGLDAEKLDARILRDFQSNPNRALKNSLLELLPGRMCPVVVQLAGLDGETAVNQITRAQRDRLAVTMKDIKLRPKAFRPIEEAVVTRGGVSCAEVNPKTMESRLVKGLFICGEMLDVDALTGGFNLQAAFSTGFLAGRNC